MKKGNTLNIEHNDEPPSYLKVLKEKFNSFAKLYKYSSSIVPIKKICSGYSKNSIFDILFIKTNYNVKKSTLKLKILELKEDSNFEILKAFRLF